AHNVAVVLEVSFRYHHNVHCLFLFTAPATSALYTLSLHDALPISSPALEHLGAMMRDFQPSGGGQLVLWHGQAGTGKTFALRARSEEHTSELQSRSDLVCRLLLEKKKNLTQLHPQARPHPPRQHEP